MGGTQSSATLIDNSSPFPFNPPACEMKPPSEKQSVNVYPIFVTFSNGEYKIITYGRNQFSAFAFTFTKDNLKIIGEKYNNNIDPSVCRAFCILISELFGDKLSPEQIAETSIYKQLKQNIEQGHTVQNKTTVEQAQDFFKEWKESKSLYEKKDSKNVTIDRLSILALTQVYKTEEWSGYAVVILTTFDKTLKETIEDLYISAYNMKNEPTNRKLGFTDQIDRDRHANVKQQNAERQEKIENIRDVLHAIQWPNSNVSKIEESSYQTVEVDSIADRQLLGSALIGYKRLLQGLENDLTSDRIQRLMMFKPSKDDDLRLHFTDKQEAGFLDRIFKTKEVVQRFLMYGSVDGKKDNTAGKTALKVAGLAAAAGVGKMVWNAYGDRIKAGWSALRGKSPKPLEKDLVGKLQRIRDKLGEGTERTDLDAIIQELVQSQMTSGYMSEASEKSEKSDDDGDKSEDFELRTEISDSELGDTITERSTDVNSDMSSDEFSTVSTSDASGVSKSSGSEITDSEISDSD